MWSLSVTIQHDHNTIDYVPNAFLSDRILQSFINHADQAPVNYLLATVTKAASKVDLLEKK